MSNNTYNKNIIKKFLYFMSVKCMDIFKYINIYNIMNISILVVKIKNIMLFNKIKNIMY